jgi:two-component system cell cycle sensor histidine kinase PleC
LARVAVIAPAEAADVDSSPELLEALDALRVAVTLFASGERLTYCNRHFNHLFRSMPPREELYGYSYAELIRLEVKGGEIAPLDADIESFVARRCAQFREGEFEPRDIPLTDGRIVEIKARRTKRGGWIALWSDVTEARHSFMRQEDLVALSADAFAFWDRKDRLLLCNDAFARIHGHSDPQSLQGCTFESLLRQSIANERFVTKAGTEAWIAQQLDAHRRPAGAATIAAASGEAFLVRDRATRDGGRATVYTDITEQRRAEAAFSEQSRTLSRTRRALAKSQVQAQQQQSYLADLTRRLGEAEADADSAKTALLRTMSHELKTPLNAIIGFADLMQMSPDLFSKEQIGEYAGVIGSAGKSLLKLINQILDLTKISAQRFPLQMTNIAVGGALWLAMDGSRAKAEQKAITLTVGDCEPDVLVRADENAFGNILAQLIDNAVTFTQAGGEVRISAARHGSMVRVTIADNGLGVAPHDLARILQPFEQAVRGTHEHAQGAGLGLPLAKALAEIQGGSLSLVSTLGNGFTASVELPGA